MHAISGISRNDGPLALSIVADRLDNERVSPTSPKIVDPELQRFAADPAADEVRSVIVELDLPPETPRSKTLPPPRAAVRARTSRSDVSSSSVLMMRLHRALESLGLADDLVRLNAAQAFVVTVSPRQLRELSKLPLVGSIRPNRTHRAPRSGSKAL